MSLFHVKQLSAGPAAGWLRGGASYRGTSTDRRVAASDVPSRPKSNCVSPARITEDPTCSQVALEPPGSGSSRLKRATYSGSVPQWKCEQLGGMSA